MGKSKESLLWCDRVKVISIAWRVLKKEGVLPEIFTKIFWKDIDQIMLIVNKNIQTRNLKEKQSLLTFDIINLRTEFGGN